MQEVAKVTDYKRLNFNVFKIQDIKITRIQDSFSEVIAEGLRHCTKIKAILNLKALVFRKKRLVLIGVEKMIEKEIDSLVSLNVIKSLDFSD